MPDKQAEEDIGKMSFEDALTALEDIVRRMESGRVNLDDAVAFYERGTLLRRHCEQKLASARLKIDAVTASLDGKANGLTSLPDGENA